MEHEISDVYFRRFLVPIVVSVLVMFAIAVIIATPPGTPAKWDSFSTAFGGISNQIAGAIMRL